MAEATSKTNKVYTLVLNGKEAEFILAITQNPIAVCETESEGILRHSIFKALHDEKYTDIAEPALQT